MNTNNHNTDSRTTSLQSAIEITFETDSQEFSQYSVFLDKNSSELQELQDAGYTVVFPTELSSDAIDKMSPEEKQRYKENMRRALILDPRDTSHSLDSVRAIASHYYSSCPGVIAGVDYTKNSLAIFPYGNFPAGTHKAFYDLLTELGYDTSLTGEQVSVSSKTPYPCVTKEKFKEIYDSAKNKMRIVAQHMGLIPSANIEAKNNNSLVIR